ncbi:Lsr2 family protein [Microbacterium sp. RURRCA19A]|uniref:histone-like nucleoid-structuring protein Lsr2 n=1 Tax=Microbacterium sp. RURRCA19A TaxID=1907391 RepID=UPI00095530DC|nr:Lsr2 family protein [Microbacterium sp. RURRCA19A]SIS10771.1 Lsr2 protein [Microbacterium sp. RURRCA19A]
MATRQIAQVIDDLDGTTLDEGEGQQITFSIEGRSYEIDLSEKNAEKFYAAFAPYVDAGRPIGSPSRRATPARAARAKSDLDLNAIREWARANGHTVSDRGRIAGPIVEAYKAANA